MSKKLSKIENKSKNILLYKKLNKKLQYSENNFKILNRYKITKKKKMIDKHFN